MPHKQDSISFDDRSTHGLRFADLNAAMEADILIEPLKLVIEYHGIQHFEDIGWFGTGPLSERVARDDEKRSQFQGAGYAVVEVPYTWNRDITSLAELIAQALEAHPDPELGRRGLELLGAQFLIKKTGS